MFRNIALTVSLIVFFLTAPRVADSAIAISGCGTNISDPGAYVVSNDLLTCPGVAIVIQASNVSLNLAGNEISCEQIDGRLDVGILATGVSDIQVRGGTISRCDNGVQFSAVTGSQISDVTFYQMSRDLDLNFGGGAILLFGGSDNAISGILSTQNVIGIGLFNSHNNRLTGNEVSENTGIPPFIFGMGIVMSQFSSGNIVNGNTARYNSDAGIVISGAASGNTVRGNEIGNSGFYGIGVFTGAAPGSPSPVGNTIQGNTTLASGTADLLEIVFAPLGNPRESVSDSCNNDWKGNTFVSTLGPTDCLQ
jgi:parallel beta-helix repeat protein